MPQLLRIGPYSIYFWSNENNPLEPIKEIVDAWLEHFGEIRFYC